MHPFCALARRGFSFATTMGTCVHSLARYCAIMAISCGKQNNPALALQILERERPIDLFLVDYAMPEMSGSAVIERAQSSQPGLKVLLITGYPEALRAGGVSGIALLAKPFKVAELKSRVAEIIARHVG